MQVNSRLRKHVEILIFCALAIAPAIVCEAITDIDIRDAILGLGTFTQDEITEMDQNGDHIVDVADLIAFNLVYPNSYPTQLRGYTWGISVIFDSDTNASVPVNYSFTIEIPTDTSPAKVVAVPGFNPTRSLTRQDLSITGEIPGKKRRDNSPYIMSYGIPPDTTFTVTETEKELTLKSETKVIPAGSKNPQNPLPISFSREWIITINKEKVFSVPDEHGSLSETVIGFAPAKETIQGTIQVIPFGPMAMKPILDE